MNNSDCQEKKANGENSEIPADFNIPLKILLIPGKSKSRTQTTLYLSKDTVSKLNKICKILNREKEQVLNILVTSYLSKIKELELDVV